MLQLTECAFIAYFTATAGEEGRKALMREIELGKRLEEVPQPNIVKFIGCVTTQSNVLHFIHVISLLFRLFFLQQGLAKTEKMSYLMKPCS